MKKLKRFLLVLTAAVMVSTGMGIIPVHADDDDDVRPTKVTVSKSAYTVTAGREFKVKAKVYPKYADEDDVRWQIISGKKYVRFDDDDRDDNEVEMKALRPGEAKVRCYVKGRDKKSSGDVVTIIVKKRKPNYMFSKVGSSTKVIEVGDDFELKVKKGHSVRDSQLKWKIDNSSIVRFDDDDRTDAEVEFKALRTGTTKVHCYSTNGKTKNKKITYVIKVIHDQDDDDDDNHDDSDD